MKTVKMQGGLGNQLFCLGFADTVARLTGETVALDLASFSADRYGHDFDLAPLGTILGMRLTRRPLMSARPVTALMRRVPTAGYVSEGATIPDHDSLGRLAKSGRYFNGYWQNEAYMSAPFRKLARDFLLDRAGPTPQRGIVIHCRTYKEEVRPERRAVPAADWFIRCFERLESLGVDTSDIALISDDPALALSWLGDIGRPVRAVTEGTASTDMALLLKARTLILTNSTFSWWGGYCGEAATILYPAKGRLFHYAAPPARFTVVD